MLGFCVSNTPSRGIAASTQIRKSPACIMRIGCQDMNQPLIQHPLCPILRIFTKSASQRTRRDLVPDTGMCKALDRIIMLTDPT